MTILRQIAKSKENANNPKKMQIIVGVNFSKILGEIPFATKKKIHDKLSFFLQGAEYTPAFKKKLWDGYIRMFYWGTQMFPTGYLKTVCRILEKRNCEFEIKDTRKPIHISRKSIDKSFKSLPGIIPRSYQKKATFKALKEKTGIINLPTGTGKTIVINLILKAIDIELKKKATHVIITTGIDLLRQLKDETEKLQKEKVGFVGEGEYDIRRINVLSIETLISILSTSKSKNPEKEKKSKEITKLLNNATAMFVDEAHHSPAKTFKNIIYKCFAPIRIGTTATYNRSGGDSKLLRAVTGRIIFKKSISWMIRKGYLAKPIIFLVEFGSRMKSPAELNYEFSKIKGSTANKIDMRRKRPTLWNKIYTVEIANNKKRDSKILKIAKILYKNNLSTIIFVVEKNHGKNLFSRAISEFNIPENKIVFLTGSSSKESRVDEIKKFRSGKTRILICTRIFNEGIDFPEINAGIKSSGLRYESGIIQQIGRVLRKVKNEGEKDIDIDTMQKVVWVDICDLHSPILAEHSLKRIEAYESEKEFDVRYIKEIKDINLILKKEQKYIRTI